MHHKYLFPAGLFILCLIIRFVYELLKETRKIDPENKLIFAGIFTVMMMLWLSWFSLCPMDPYKIELSVWIGWTGLAVCIAGTLMAVGALIQLRGVENIDHLVTTGLFRKIRHPMYMGFISWILGWSVYHGAMVSLAIGALGIISVLWWRYLEDVRLEVQFGGRYKEYRLTTWF